MKNESSRRLYLFIPGVLFFLNNYLGPPPSPCPFPVILDPSILKVSTVIQRRSWLGVGRGS